MHKKILPRDRVCSYLQSAEIASVMENILSNIESRDTIIKYLE